MSSYRLFSAIGAAVAVVVWCVKMPLLFEMTRVGEISAMAMLLLLVAVISLALAALRVYFGKGARGAFVLHIVFAVVAAAMGEVFPPVPLALGLAVAVAALVWSFAARQLVELTGRDAQ